VAGVRDSFRAGRRPEVDPAEGQAMFDTGLDEAVARLTAHLRKEPRHELFAKDCKKWLLKLAFGPSEAKEAKEAKQAKEAKKAKKAKEAAKIAGAKPASD
jgi:pantoate kinase